MTPHRVSCVMSSALLLGVACASASGPPPPARTLPATARDSSFEAVRLQVTNGSIVADAQLGRMPPMAVGACIDPKVAARFELDRSLELIPDHPPTLIGAFDLPRLPESVRDSEVRSGIVTARWVVDTNGTAIPGSVSIVSSPHGFMSLQVCGAIIGARFTPARDEGRVVRARVDMPVKFVP